MGIPRWGGWGGGKAEGVRESNKPQFIIEIEKPRPQRAYIK